MEQRPDGWLFVCKLCGKEHEVPEAIAPYWNGHALARIPVGDMTLGCSEKPQTAQYTFADFKPYKVT